MPGGASKTVRDLIMENGSQAQTCCVNLFGLLVIFGVVKAGVSNDLCGFW